ncbi:50S ribosomal protein L24 [Oenococcus alcoholitolerans]|uniref:Large ribosomal subunit protein uL24 n=1 Tax=Oenococcus alcoholitolerans TaxID=931074 RepID=A0ABR4XR10_9LACO|nr:50S ribosomal protein L24 [Oenococcus alcoholitolerans]
MSIKTGDRVRVIAGKDKGKEGKVIKVFLKKDRVIVQGANKVTKHKKATQNQNAKKGIVEEEAAIHISNVSLLDSSKDTVHANKRENANK